MNPDLSSIIIGMRRYLRTAVVRLFMLIILFIMIIVRTMQVQLTARGSSKPGSSVLHKLQSDSLPA